MGSGDCGTDSEPVGSRSVDELGPVMRDMLRGERLLAETSGKWLCVTGFDAEC